MSVGKVIVRAWASAGRGVVPLLGLGWLTTTFYGGAVAYFLQKLSAATLAGPQPDQGGFNDFAVFYLFCLMTITAFANAVIGLPMTREALQPSGEWKTAYFCVGRQEWSLFANLLLLYVIVTGLVAAIMFAGNVGIAVSLPMIGNGGVWNGIALAPSMSGAIVVVAIAVGLFLAARFGFFLAPVAVADPPARLLKAWILSRGKFWRLLTISLGLLAPVVVFALLLDWALLGSKFGDALIALFATPHNMILVFKLIRESTGPIATVWAVGLFLWNAIFAGASADAYARAGQGVESASNHDLVSGAESAPAMAALPVHSPRVEPAFQTTEVTEPIAKLWEARPEHDGVRPEPLIDSSLEKKYEVPPSELAAEEKTAERDHQAEEIEFRTVEDLPSLVTIGPTAEVSPALEEAHFEITASTEAHEEPLAPQEPLHAMNPLDHAAPAAPDPAGVAATPLPAFVEAHSSPEHEPSEAA